MQPQTKINDIENKEDIQRLVTIFIKRIRDNHTMGAIAELMIPNWKRHTETLIDFWELKLFPASDAAAVRSSFLQKEVVSGIERIANNRAHLRLWLNLWVATVDDHFIGDIASQAKKNARLISTMISGKYYQDATLEAIS